MMAKRRWFVDLPEIKGDDPRCLDLLARHAHRVEGSGHVADKLLDRPHLESADRRKIKVFLGGVAVVRGWAKLDVDGAAGVGAVVEVGLVDAPMAKADGVEVGRVEEPKAPDRVAVAETL